MLRPYRFPLLVTLLLAAPMRVDGQVPVLPDLLPGERDTSSYPTLLRLLESSKASHQRTALGRMRLSYPDSARAWAIRHLPSLGGFDATVAATTIIGDSGEGVAALVRLLPSLPDSVLQGVESPLAIGLGRSGLPWDSVGVELFRSTRSGIRVLAMGLVQNQVDDSPVPIAQREYLDLGTRDRESKVRAAALAAIAWRLPRSDSASMEWGVPYFVAALSDRNGDMRAEALHDIAWRGLPVPGEVERIRQFARSATKSDERQAALMALAVQGQAALSAIPDLIGYLQGGDRRLGSDALRVITEMGRRGATLPTDLRLPVGTFRRRLVNPYEQLEVIRALAALRDTSALAELTRDRDTIIAVGALRSLARVAPTHPALVAALDDPRSKVVGVALIAMVPILFRDSTPSSPRTATGLAALDSARVLARSLVASRLVGQCFSVKRDAFEPAIRLGLDSVYSTPPRTIAFLADPFDFPADDGYEAMIAVANGAAPTLYGIAVWRWDVADDSLRAGWSTGFSGVTLNAAWSGDLLNGMLTTFWDFPRTRQNASVTLTPVVCTSIGSNRPEF